MSDILIKNMEMPKCCGECPMSQLINDNQYAYCHLLSKGTKVGYMLKACPLVELSPHGRLVDADKLRGETNYLICTDCEVESCEDCDVEWCKNIIENAPTVLEASKERK